MGIEYKLWGLVALALIAIAGLIWWCTEDPFWAGEGEEETHL